MKGIGSSRKKNINEGRKVAKGRIYDSVNGQSCHCCRQKTVGEHVQCSVCTVKFCGICLYGRHGEDAQLEMEADNSWICPKCRKGCGRGCNHCCYCVRCRRQQGLAANRDTAYLARRAGFTNVHDYLIFKATGESPNEIAQRKIGRGWCRSAGNIMWRSEDCGSVTEASLATQIGQEYSLKNLKDCTRGSLSEERADATTKARAPGVSQNSSMHFPTTLDQKPCYLIRGLLETSACLSCQEEHGRLTNSEPRVTRNCVSLSGMGSKSMPKVKPWFSDLCIAFSRDINDIVWATYKDFELPLAFRVQQANFDNVCRDIEIDSDEEDEDYKFFLDNLRECDTYQVLELKDAHGKQIDFVRFEEVKDELKLHQCCDGNLKPEFPRNRQEHTSRCGDDETCMDSKKNLDCRHSLPNKRFKLKASVVSPNEEIRKRMRLMDFDERSVVWAKSRPTGMTIKAKIAKRIRKGKSTLQCHRRHFAKTEESFLPETSPSHVTVIDRVGSRGIPFCIQSVDFRKNLEATLKEPFNTQQLHEMWNALNCRKPIVRYRETRHRTVLVETNQEGSSYLDYYPDLAERIASVTTLEEKLALSRGFFFWLKHLSWPDAFQPWVSSSMQKSSTKANDEDDCVEVDQLECEVVAVVVNVDDTEIVPTVSQKEFLPKIEVKEEKP